MGTHLTKELSSGHKKEMRFEHPASRESWTYVLYCVAHQVYRTYTSNQLVGRLSCLRHTLASAIY